MGRLLIVEDDSDLRDLLLSLFRDSLHEVDGAPDGETAVRLLRERHYEVVLTDLVMPGTDGVAVLREAKAQDPNTEVIILSGKGTIELVAEALRGGAFDYIQKPFDSAELSNRVESAFHAGSVRHELAFLRHRREVIYRVADLVGVSPAIAALRAQVELLAGKDDPVLLTGEEGTGRQLIAGTLHYNSKRRWASFIALSAAGREEKLVESELFGSDDGQRRVGRLEQADGGTLFLGQVTSLSRRLQERLVEVFTTRSLLPPGSSRPLTLNTRLLASANRHPEEEVAAGRLLPALADLLAPHRIHIPPLKERKEDILPLADFFLRKLRGELGRNVSGFTEEARTALAEHGWPGNVRELRNAVERALLAAEGGMIEARDLGLGEGNTLPIGGPDGMALKELEREAVMEALRKSDWVQKDAAALLGISKRAMHYKVTQFGIKHPRWLKNR